MTRTPRRALAALLVALVGAAGLVGLVGPAQAARTVTIAIVDGTTPNSTRLAPGDRVQFRNTSSTTSFGVNGAFSTGLLRPGTTSAPSRALPAGTYDYVVQLGNLVPTGGGRITVVAPGTPSPTAPPTTTAPATPGAPAAPTSPPSSSAPAAPGTPVRPRPPTVTTGPVAPGTASPGVVVPAPDGGTGVALRPRLDTGSLLLPPPPAGPGGLDPQLAPEAVPTLLGPGYELPFAQPSLDVPQVETPVDALGGAGVLTERLNAPDSVRRYGLPAALGLVLLLGVGSLVVRVLLATTTLRARLHGRGPARA